MKKCFHVDSSAKDPLHDGPLSPYLGSFASLLVKHGYSSETSRRKIRLGADLSRWLSLKSLRLEAFDERLVTRFLEARWQRVPRRSGDKCTLALLLRHLRREGIVPLAVAPIPSPIDSIELDYGQFLLGERGIMPSSVGTYLRVVRRFLSHRFQGEALRLRLLRGSDITAFVLRDTSTRGRCTAQLTTVVLRSFLGFLFQRGRTTTNLSPAVPTVAAWRLSELPRFLEAAQVERLLRCCDRRRKIGKRDYAALLLIARLGLRAGEVAGLRLEDINWTAGELLVCGKGARIDRLPLLQDVGEALADYLQKGRPDCATQSVFVQSKAPYDGLSGRPSTIGGMVHRALVRAQLNPHHQGARLLRHSLATRMLRRGASLAQIGQVLRHARIRTTEIYAKVDLNALRALAQPWPGGAQ